MKLKLAILDMNKQQPNQGMRCIRDIVRGFESELDWEEFEVRVANEVPDTDFDIYISSGGPGNPLEGNGIWEKKFFDLLDRLSAHNQSGIGPKKHFFFICHSFQLACKYFELGEITRRRSTAFGIMPVHKTSAGSRDRVLQNLPDPYFAVDSRDWQLIQPNLDVFEQHGATILSLEKIRPHVDLERAVMAVRFSPEFVGTQFHPEADPEGMRLHFQQEKTRQLVIKNHGEEKYQSIMEQMDDPDKIALTHRSILPNFIEQAIQSIRTTSTDTVLP